MEKGQTSQGKRTGEYCQQPSTTLPQLWRSLLGLGARVCPLGVLAEHRVNLSGAQVHEELGPVMGQNNHQEPGLNYSPSRPRCPFPTSDAGRIRTRRIWELSSGYGLPGAWPLGSRCRL